MVTVVYFAFFFISICSVHGFLFDGLGGVLSGKRPSNSNCSLRPADLVFLLDASGSEGPRHFHEELEFMKQFVNGFDIGPNNVQIGAVSFSTHAHNQFNLNSYRNKADLEKAIGRIWYTSGGTHTNEAIDYAVLHSFSPIAGDRKPVTDVMFVVTDGQSLDPRLTKEAADRAHKAGIKVFAIGVGNGISKTELQNIASDKNHIFHVSTFDALHTLQEELRKKTCEAIEYSSLYCRNHIPNCDRYGHAVCISYAQWGRDNCALYCGYCAAQGTPPPPNTTISTTKGSCVDTLSNCHDYTLAVCASYREWSKTNCPRYCGFCKGPPTPAPPVTATTMSVCKNAASDQVCQHYGQSMCSTSPEFGKAQCAKYCRICSGIY